MRGGWVMSWLLAVLGVSAPAAAQPRPDVWHEGPEVSRDPPAAPGPVPDDLPRLRGKELRDHVPDLQISSWPPPPIQLQIGPSMRFPFSIVALELGAVVYAAWLRVEARYAAGYLAGSQGGDAFSNYAEALVGLRVLGGAGERNVELRPDDDVPWYEKTGKYVSPNPTLKVALPSYHALFVEAGGFTGPIFFERCVENCTELTGKKLDERVEQLVFGAAGLRYVYRVNVTSEREKRLTRRQRVELFLHALTPPLRQPDQEIWLYGKQVTHASFGARIGAALWVCRSFCNRFGGTFGYLPTPGAPMFGIEYSVEDP